MYSFRPSASTKFGSFSRFISVTIRCSPRSYLSLIWEGLSEPIRSLGGTSHIDCSDLEYMLSMLLMAGVIRRTVRLSNLMLSARAHDGNSCRAPQAATAQVRWPLLWAAK